MRMLSCIFVYRTCPRRYILTHMKDLSGNPPNGYPGSNVGPEPTTDRFMAIMHGNEDRVLPGNAVAVSPGKPFKGLQVIPTLPNMPHTVVQI
jgi:hypothetical protein